MVSDPLVSIVIPCFNQGKYLPESLHSALTQTYTNIEVIIVDDASTDPDTLTLLDRLEKDNRAIVRLAKNQGLPAARNAGIRIASGEFILPLDADDHIDATYVTKAVKAMVSTPNTGIVYADEVMFGEREGPGRLPQFELGRQLAGNCIHCCALFRRSDWETVGGYDEKMRTGLEDWDFWLSIIGLGKGVIKIPEELFHYRQHEDSMLHRMSQKDWLNASSYIFRKHLPLYSKYADLFLPYVDTEVKNQLQQAMLHLDEAVRNRNQANAEANALRIQLQSMDLERSRLATDLAIESSRREEDRRHIDDARNERDATQAELAMAIEASRAARREWDVLRSSWSFRLGRAITWPLRLVYELCSHGPRSAYHQAILPLYPPALRRWTDRWYARAFSTGTTPWNVSQQSSTDPLVSVVIPVYDRTDVLRLSIRSILDQTFTDFEIIIVTDGSPQATLDVIDEFRIHPKVRVFEYADNTGNAVRGRNRGIQEARGKYVAFQDSDDEAEPRRLEWSVAELEKGMADVVYGGWRARLDGSRHLDDVQDGQEVFSPDCDLESLLETCVPCQSTVMVRRDALLDVGGLKTTMQYREDHELWCRLAFFGYRFKSLHAVLTNLRLHKGNNELNFQDNSGQWHRILKDEYATKAFFPFKVAFLIPGTGISGGIYVVFEHATRLSAMGHHVTILTRDPIRREDLFWHPRAASLQWATYHEAQDRKFDVCFATWWQTAYDLAGIPAHHHAYFNQSVESRFYPESETEVRSLADGTYRLPYPIVTEATWIRDLIREKYHKEAHLVRNGIRKDLYRFDGPAIAPREAGKLRVLVEGPLEVPFKNVAKTIELCRGIADELWLFTSSDITSVPGVDRVFSRVPITAGPAIYRSCDVLVKLSLVEGMFGPPLEMFHCGGTAIVYDVSGHDEYIRHGENALVADRGDEDTVRAYLQSLKDDVGLLAHLKEGALSSAAQWPDWETSSQQFETAIHTIISTDHPAHT